MTAAARQRIDAALAAARDTRTLEMGRSMLAAVPSVFERHFGRRTTVVVADRNTMRAAGNAVSGLLPGLPPFVFEDRDFYAEHRFVERLTNSLASHDAIPVAVGAGTINDIVKLAAYRTGRQYLCVPTAASMDGYTAYGSSITYRGSKQTFDCPAPVAVVADIDVIRAAPREMTAAGYADLLAKLTAGADWIVADALGAEPIDARAWSTVQGGLKDALSGSIEQLVEGLMMGGFAMQATQTSRPASGAEHQFSHLWDMQHHTHNGVAPSHGFKVAVATVGVARLYETLLGMKPAGIVAHPAANFEALFDIPELREKARQETRAKTVPGADLRAFWSLGDQLREQLPAAAKIVQMLKAAGAPTEPEQIGISRKQMRDSYRLAYHIRRRFTILDVAVLSGQLDACLAKMFPEVA
jgi:glycerol-1-phosphate dehydrogenase [NAD(P)+]